MGVREAWRAVRDARRNIRRGWVASCMLVACGGVGCDGDRCQGSPRGFLDDTPPFTCKVDKPAFVPSTVQLGAFGLDGGVASRSVATVNLVVTDKEGVPRPAAHWYVYRCDAAALRADLLPARTDAAAELAGLTSVHAEPVALRPSGSTCSYLEPNNAAALRCVTDGLGTAAFRVVRTNEDATGTVAVCAAEQFQSDPSRKKAVLAVQLTAASPANDLRLNLPGLSELSVLDAGTEQFLLPARLRCGTEVPSCTPDVRSIAINVQLQETDSSGSTLVTPTRNQTLSVDLSGPSGAWLSTTGCQQDTGSTLVPLVIRQGELIGSLNLCAGPAGGSYVLSISHANGAAKSVDIEIEPSDVWAAATLTTDGSQTENLALDVRWPCRPNFDAGDRGVLSAATGGQRRTLPARFAISGQASVVVERPEPLAQCTMTLNAPAPAPAVSDVDGGAP